MRKSVSFAVIALLMTLAAGCGPKAPSYEFDGSISEEVLNNYLSRSVTMTEILTRSIKNKEPELEFIRRSGVKYIGRAIYCWSGQQRLGDQTWLDEAAATAAKIHEIDPDIILQACLFEAVYKDGFEQVHIPAWAFEALGMEPEDRNFDFEAVQFPDGSFVNHWGPDTCVPDIRQAETRLWFMFLLGTYVKLGVESFHLGQNMLIGSQDKDWKVYDEFLATAREYASKYARRHFVMFDSHAGPRGMITPDGRSLIDFNAFPLRIKAVEGEPEKGMLEVGFLDALFCKSPGGKTPSGWSCESLPYLVEFDNFGLSDHPGEDRGDIYIWGYDEISWFYKQPLEYKKEFLHYAWNWLKETDPAAHLQMPTVRVISLPGVRGLYSRCGEPTEDNPGGMGLDDEIISIWNNGK